MEDEKLSRLYDTLAKLAPKGKVGGLGFHTKIHQPRKLDPTLPVNRKFDNFDCFSKILLIS